jgi:hypothetical protein
MQILKKVMLSSMALIFVSTTASADENDTLCSMYSKTGGAMSEFMLPLTVQDFINMINGSDQGLMNDMVKAMTDAWSGSDMVALSKLNTEDAEIIGEAAGQVAIELLMTGQASTKTEVTQFMNKSCMTVGAKNIIRNQRKSRAATAAIMGQ